MLAFLGIDLGTSSIRALLLSFNGDVLAQSQENYNFNTPKNSWAEQNPEEWWDACCRVVIEVTQTAGLSTDSIIGLSFSGQMHGLVTLDIDGNVIRPAIIWCDQRSRIEVEFLNSQFTRQEWQDLTLNPTAAGFLLPSLLWLRNNEPTHFRMIKTVLLPKDYLRYRMTGTLATDYSDAAGTSAFDVKRACWSRILLEKLDLNLNIFPPILASTSDCGAVLPEIATALCISPSCRVFCGAADQVMQAVGNGIVGTGTGSVTVGTGGQVLAPMSSPLVLPAMNAHVFNFIDDKSWFFLGANLSAGLALRWLRDNILVGMTYKEMDQMASEVPLGSDGVIFLPYLLGERTPHMDPSATAQFTGLRFVHNRSHLIRALLEGVAFALKESFELLPDENKPSRVFISGGGAQSPLWRQIIADVLDQSLLLSAGAEQAALGAAVIAAYGSGLFNTLSEAVTILVPAPISETKPIKENVIVYQECFENYKSQYRKA